VYVNRWSYTGTASTISSIIRRVNAATSPTLHYGVWSKLTGECHCFAKKVKKLSAGVPQVNKARASGAHTINLSESDYVVGMSIMTGPAGCM
jgi:hypothetical protein